MTRYEAYVEKHWEDHGLAHLLVARTREDGATDSCMKAPSGCSVAARLMLRSP